MIRASLHEAGIRSCIPPKSNRKAKIRWTRRMYRERNRIERTIGHLKIKRAARRPQRRPRVARGATYIAPDTKVGASTSSASSFAEGSLIVIRHSVRGSFGSVSVAECRSEALSHMTMSPTR
jgi:hypothetical protein